MYTVNRLLNLGATATGLTLSAQLYNTAGATVGGAVAAGFIEHGLGFYSWNYASVPDGFVGAIRFTSGGGVTLRQVDAIGPKDAVDACLTAAEVSQLRFRLAMDGAQVAPAVTTGTILAVKEKTDLIGSANGSTSGGTVPVTTALSVPGFARWSQGFTATGNAASDWLQFAFTIKTDPERDSDAEALLVVRITNPAASGTDGLLVQNRQAVPTANRTRASITVASVTPDTTVTVTANADAMQLPPSPSGKPYRYELTRWSTAKGKEILGLGNFTVTRSVRRLTAAP